jgi:hypothetical protein
VNVVKLIEDVVEHIEQHFGTVVPPQSPLHQDITNTIQAAVQAAETDAEHIATEVKDGEENREVKNNG